MLQMFRSKQVGSSVSGEKFSNTRTYFIANLAKGCQDFFFTSLRRGRIGEGPMRTLHVMSQCWALFVGFATEGYYLIDSFERHLG